VNKHIPTNQKPIVKPKKVYDNKCTYEYGRIVKGREEYTRCNKLMGHNYFFCAYHAKLVD